MTSGGHGKPPGRDVPADRGRRPAEKPLARQAAEGIGVVVLLALGAILTGLALSAVVALVF